VSIFLTEKDMVEWCYTGCVERESKGGNRPTQVLEVCRKPKSGLHSDTKNPNRIRTIQKFDICADGFRK